MCCTMYHYSQVYHKRVLTAETVFTHKQQQQPPPLQQHCHCRPRRFVTQSFHSLTFSSSPLSVSTRIPVLTTTTTSTSSHISPPHPWEPNEKKKKKENGCSSGSCVFSRPVPSSSYSRLSPHWLSRFRCGHRYCVLSLFSRFEPLLCASPSLLFLSHSRWLFDFRTACGAGDCTTSVTARSVWSWFAVPRVR